MKKIVLLTIIAGCLAACQNKIEEVPYTLANHYFVKNNVAKVDHPKIADEKTFHEVFGAAAVMGDGGNPTPIDFNKQYAVAIVLDETDVATAIEDISVHKNTGSGQVEVNYKVKTGEKQSFTTRPTAILIINKAHEGEVLLKEIK
ncbi:hypothetical protein SAMN05216436_1443 [bacterium A37T11]|nr:hypothetical protein SAMN05216436_1443 [bacterium A37T11]